MKHGCFETSMDIYEPTVWCSLRNLHSLVTQRYEIPKSRMFMGFKTKRFWNHVNFSLSSVSTQLEIKRE